MLNKNIKTVYHGEVGIHEKYLDSGGLILNYVGEQEEYEGGQMFLNQEQLQQGRRGKETYRDRHDPTKQYQLIYYKWTETKHQPTLL